MKGLNRIADRKPTDEFIAAVQEQGVDVSVNASAPSDYMVRMVA